MDPGEMLKICRDALQLVILLSMPALGASLILGLVISIFQATTQIQEQTLSFVPKMIAVFAVLAMMSGWMMATMKQFAERLLNMIPDLLAKMN